MGSEPSVKPRHVFANKKEPTLSLSWLDENFQQPLDLIEGMAARFDLLGNRIADQDAIILKLQDQIKKLRPKPVPPKAKK
jgi:hypothetical protein